jgi:homocysteine S-methyltransferase
MSPYRHALPQLGDRLFMTDGGLETYLVFHEGVDLPAFAAFDQLRDEVGCARLRRYFERYVAMARSYGCGLLLEAPTWRANRDWGAVIGYDAAALAEVNRRAVGMLQELRTTHATATLPIVVSGVIGPRGDGYRVEQRMSVGEARDYHDEQLRAFADSAADMAVAYTMNYVEEAIGIADAARAQQLPVALSFTLETDGHLPSGETLESAILRTDAATDRYPAYYMINCAHPAHFAPRLAPGTDWVLRIGGLRANASRLSHAELEQCTELDAGDPLELGQYYRGLQQQLPRLTVLGGCCGTDHRHIGAICAAVAPLPGAA